MESARRSLVQRMTETYWSNGLTDPTLDHVGLLKTLLNLLYDDNAELVAELDASSPSDHTLDLSN